MSFGPLEANTCFKHAVVYELELTSPNLVLPSVSPSNPATVRALGTHSPSRFPIFETFSPATSRVLIKNMSEKDHVPALAEASESDTSGRLNGDVPAETKEDGPGLSRDIHGVKWALTVGSVLSCVFLFALDTTVVSLRVRPSLDKQSTSRRQPS